jgi:hypothetical protein
MRILLIALRWMRNLILAAVLGVVALILLILALIFFVDIIPNNQWIAQRDAEARQLLQLDQRGDTQIYSCLRTAGTLERGSGNDLYYFAVAAVESDASDEDLVQYCADAFSLEVAVQDEEKLREFMRWQRGVIDFERQLLQTVLPESRVRFVAWTPESKWYFLDGLGGEPKYRFLAAG